MNGAGYVSNRLAQLSERFASARQSDRDRYGRFFTALGARMEGARAADRELDRLLARRFNALDYLRKDELGLSRIIADLLDPDGSHGQGVCFLERFRSLVGPNRWPADGAVRCEDFDIKVVRERKTDGGGFLDISVELRLPGRGSACVVFENKPFAADGKNQIADYLKFLRCYYGTRFLLIYLSGHGGMPSEFALPKGVCTDGLAIMPFCPRETAGDDKGNLALRLSFSLSDWLRECRQICEAERLRWFLREFETFCHNTFGGIMMTMIEQKELKNFILESDDNVLTAIAVVESWPTIRNEVVRQFLGVLRDRIDANLDTVDDIHVCSGFDGVKFKKKNGIWAFRKEWNEASSPVPLICLNHEQEAKKWYVGVYMDSEAKEVKDRGLEERLRGSLGQNKLSLGGKFDDAALLWYRYLEEHQDWSTLLARLHKEVEDQKGELTDYFSRQIVETAKLVIPIIDRVVGNFD